MKFVFRFLIVLIVSVMAYQSADAQILEPVRWKFETKEISTTEVELVFTATIEDHWHLYAQWLPEGNFSLPTVFEFDSIAGIELVDSVIGLSEVHEAYEELADAMSRWYEGTAIFTQRVKIIGNKPYVKGYIDFMSCDDEQCIKLDEDFVFDLSVGSTETIGDNKGGESKDSSLLTFFILAFLGGLVAILTPCVFPMIPMTVSFFMHSGGDNKNKARANALIYGISIIAIYTAIGSIVSVTLGPEFSNWLSTHWLPNIFFFLIFIIFAASFFGMFEIVLPSWMVNSADKQVDKGGFLGSFFMAFTLVLVSFSCTAPIVGSILVLSADGAVIRPIVGMVGFSLAFAIPFTFFAFFPSKLGNLPKSGGWLNSVKVVLGFIEVALGFKFLSVADQTYHWGLLDREVYLSIWIVTFSLLGMYLLGKLKFAHDSEVKYLSVPRLGLAIVVFSFVVYLVPGMFGAPLKALSGYLPPQATHDFDIERIVRDNTPEITYDATSVLHNNGEQDCELPKYSDFLHLPHGIKGYFDYEQALACAKAQNKPIFIDFTGHGCVNCREMEARVWADAEVLKRLNNNFIVVALYVDDKTKLDESEWVKSQYDGKMKKSIGKKFADFQITRFKTNAQPYYCLLDSNGELLVDPKAYDLNVSNFVEFLDKGLAEFENR
ncbi:MAG: thioredoxin family protein [Salinivirgaceae bacterium]|jgi:cytochrome c biogenesis protein CcdA/thioredoxin-related protein|nr:thioredoxin family protein [Salinivirgaceae bacterium]